jgi:CRP-like cAMP-binding protein
MFGTRSRCANRRYALQSSFLPTRFDRYPKVVVRPKENYGSTIPAHGAVFKDSPLFRGLSAQECEIAAGRARERKVAKNDIIFRQGETSREMSIVTAGCAKLSYLQASGHELIWCLRTAREALDASAVFGGEHRATAQAMTESTLLSWTLPTLDSLILAVPQLGKNLHRVLLEDFTDLQQRYSELTTDSVERRVACALIRLADQIGRREPTGGVTVHISREELGQMVGTTLFTVSRLVTKWGDLGVLLPGRGALSMIRLEELHELTLNPESVRDAPLLNRRKLPPTTSPWVQRS